MGLLGVLSTHPNWAFPWVHSRVLQRTSISTNIKVSTRRAISRNEFRRSGWSFHSLIFHLCSGTVGFLMRYVWPRWRPGCKCATHPSAPRFHAGNGPVPGTAAVFMLDVVALESKRAATFQLEFTFSSWLQPCVVRPLRGRGIRGLVRAEGHWASYAG